MYFAYHSANRLNSSLRLVFGLKPKSCSNGVVSAVGDGHVARLHGYLLLVRFETHHTNVLHIVKKTLYEVATYEASGTCHEDSLAFEIL